MMSSTAPTVLTADDRERFGLLGAQASPLVTADRTAGAWEAVELALEPGAASPRHTVAAFKAFFVASGRVTITLQDDDVDAGPGTVVHIPAGTSHRYRNTSDAPATLLVLTSGDRQVSFLRGMSRLTAGGRPDPEELAAHTAAHGVTMI